jgi:Na+/alanine symporter
MFDCLGWPLLAAGHINDLWFALPLIVAVSMVYSATRHEAMEAILAGAVRIGAWITGFMLVVFAILFVISSML